MKPANFPEQNVIYAENQPQYTPLPAFKTDEGEVITAWDLSDDELDKIQRTGRIYLSQLTFNQDLQPVLLTVDRPDILKIAEKKRLEREN